MGSLGFTLADRLGAKSLPCSVPGCTRTWISMAGAGGTRTARASSLGGRGAAKPDDPASSMCDPCRDKLAKARDAAARLRSPRLRGHLDLARRRADGGLRDQAAPRRRACAPTASRSSRRLEDKPVPCSVPGCTRASVFTRRAQLLAGAPDVEVAAARHDVRAVRRASSRSSRTARSAAASTAARTSGPGRRTSRSRPTRQGSTTSRRAACARSASSPSAASPIARCAAAPRAARTPGPGRAAISSTRASPASPRPRRRTACASAATASISTLKDVERPCRRAGCKGTWLDKRGAQLARAVRGKTGDPYPQYCESCEKELGDLEDRQIACKTDNCTGTWTWTKAAAARRGRAAGAQGARAAEAAPRRREPPSRGRRDGRGQRRGRGQRGWRCGRAVEGQAPTPPEPSAVDRGAARGKAATQQEPQAPRDPPARAALPDLPRVPRRSQDDRDRLPGLQDAHLLAAREPAADAPRHLVRAVAVRRLQARPHRGAARGPARGAAPPAARRGAQPPSPQAPRPPTAEAPAVEPPAPETRRSRAPALSKRSS